MRITDDGTEVLSSLSISHLNAKIREQERLDRQQRRFKAMLSRYTKSDSNENNGLVSDRSSKKMNVEIKTRKAFTVMGIKGRGKNAEEFIPALWKEFNKRSNEFKDKIITETAFGICYEINKQAKVFSYMVAHEIDPYTDVLDGMITLHIPELTYVVVECTLPTLSDAWKYASEWISKNDYKDLSKNIPEFELYPEKWENEKSDPIYIYVPVKKK